MDDAANSGLGDPIAGAIMGVGSVTKLSVVRWGVAGRVLLARVRTIPAAGVVAGLTFCSLALRAARQASALGVPR